MNRKPIACTEVTLDEVEPAVIRTLEVPLDIRLNRLHFVLQVAFGWTDSHLWEFRAGDGRWGRPDPDWPDDGTLDAAGVSFGGVIASLEPQTLT